MSGLYSTKLLRADSIHISRAECVVHSEHTHTHKHIRSLTASINFPRRFPRLGEWNSCAITTKQSSKQTASPQPNRVEYQNQTHSAVFVGPRSRLHGKSGASQTTHKQTTHTKTRIVVDVVSNTLQAVKQRIYIF